MNMAIQTETKTVFTTTDGATFEAAHDDATAVAAAKQEAINHEIVKIIVHQGFGTSHLWAEPIAAALQAAFHITPKE